MRTEAIVFAAALVMAPLGARAADLVVWWEEGYYARGGRGGQGDRRRLRAGDRQAGRAGLPSTGGASRGDRGGARGRPAARLRLRPAVRPLHRTMGLRRSARGPLGRHRPLLGPVRSGRARAGNCVLNAKHRAKGPVRAADGPYDQPRPRLEEPPGARGLHPRRHPEGVGGVLVLLVRPGAAGGAQGHWAATTSGASACPCRSRVDTAERVLPVPGCLRGGLRDPRRPPRHRRPRDQAQAHRGHRQLHRHLPQGLHAARRGELGHRRPQQQGVPRADRGDDGEPDALDPERAQARAARRLLREHRHDRMATRSVWRALSDHRASSSLQWSSRMATTSRPPRSSCASWSARAGSRTISTSPASACCRRCRSCSSSRSGSTRAIRTAWPR